MWGKKISGGQEEKHAECPENQISPSTVFIQYLGLCLSEMTNDCLAVLRMCCSPTVLQALELLVSKVRSYKAYSATTCYEVFQMMHHDDLAAFYVPAPPVPGAVCIGEGGDASEQRWPGCTA